MIRILLSICFVCVIGLASAVSQQQPVLPLSNCQLYESDFEYYAFQKSHNEFEDLLAYFLALDSSLDSTTLLKAENQLARYSARLALRKHRLPNQSRFLEFVFFDIHRKYLKRYVNQYNFSGLLDKGYYNCLTASGLYAYVLTQLGFSAKIYETRFHVFLKLQLPDSSGVLLESTDPLYGLVFDAEEVEKRVFSYLEQDRKHQSDQNLLSPPFNADPLLQEITLKELAGLQYFNLAVDLLNEDNDYEAIKALKKALMLYPESERIQHLFEFTCSRYMKTPLQVAVSDNLR